MCKVTRVACIQILYHCSVSWKIAPPYFFISKITYVGQKESIKVEFLGLLSGWVNIYQIPHVIFKATIQFFSKLCITLQCHGRELFYTFLAETLYDLGKRTPSKCKNSDFWLLREVSQNLYFDSFLLLKVYKIWAKIVRRSYVSWHWRMMQTWRGMDLLFRNWHEESDEFWPKHSKVSKICTLMGSFWPKYIMLGLSREELCLMALKIDAKFGGKLTGAFKIDMSNLANTHRLKKSDFILEIKMAELNKKKRKFKTSRSTRCSLKTLF